MDLQRQMNIDFVVEHKKLHHNIDAFWGPENIPFSYMTSKWGEESSREVLSDSDNSYQTSPLMDSSEWDQLQEVQLLRGDGETSLSPRRQLSLSLLWSQPHVLLSGGPTRILKQCGHRTKGKLVKASWTNLSRKSVETVSSGSSKRVRSPTLLEYASDHPVPSLSRVDQDVLMSREGSPDYSKWVPSDYFGRMSAWLANVDLGKPPSDEEKA